ncbi:MAG: SpvB/TcaC N-terminal domain-containing protein, partial [Pseudomonadota bacterium]
MVNDDDDQILPLHQFCSNLSGSEQWDYAVYDQPCQWDGGAGNYRFALVAGSEYGDGSLASAPVLARSTSLSVSVSSTLPPVNSEPNQTPVDWDDVNWQTLLPEHQPVGAIPGDFQVTQSGAASYRIPIKVSQGRGDFAPQLALTFNSHAGPGYAGEKWSLGGLSSISRCGQTIAQDVSSTTVALDNSQDRFCLDGQRLILKAGGNYGDHATEYRLELNDHTRVYFFNPMSAPSHFVVQRKDGTTEYYGAIPDFSGTGSAYIPAEGIDDSSVALLWPLSRREDSAGNYFEYDYLRAGLSQLPTTNCSTAGAIEWVPSSIRYTGNGNHTPHSSLNFEWEANAMCRASATDVAYATGRINGQALQSTLRLAAIRSMDGADEIRRYDLGYRNTDRRDFLETIKECWGSSSGDCYTTPTEIVWDHGSIEHGGVRNASGTIDRFRSAQAGDIDGDGRDEVAFLQKQNGNAVFGYFDSDFVNGQVQIVQTPSARIDGTNTVGMGDVKRFGWALADVQGNGRMGVVFGRYHGNNFNVCNNGDPCVEVLFKPYANEQFSGQSHRIGVINKIEGDFDPELDALSISVSDLDGDGLVDVIAHRSSELNIASNRHMAWVWLNNSQRHHSIPSWTNAIPLINSGFIKDDPTQCEGNYIHRVRAEIQSGGFSLDHSSRTALVVQARVSEFCVTGPIPRASQEMPPIMTEQELQHLIQNSTEGLIFNRNINESGIYFISLSEQNGEWSGGLSKAASIEIREGNHDSRLAPVDFNGDGLTDVLKIAAVNDGDDIELELLINQGTTGQPDQMFQSAPGFPVDHHLKFKKRGLISMADITGDGRPELMIPAATDGRSAIEWRSWPWVDASGLKPSSLIASGQLIIDDQDDEHPETLLMFDPDGNGVTDFGVLGDHGLGGESLRWAESSVSGNNVERFVPNHSVSAITDGLGAMTLIDYLPQSSVRVYRRDTGNGWADGTPLLAPVYDLIGSTYVVSSVSSSAPAVDPQAAGSVEDTFEANAMTTVEYHYTGAKLQGYGRGSLGYRQMASFSPDTRVLTVTEYYQPFPLTGLPRRTAQFYIPSGQPPWQSEHDFDSQPLCSSSCDQAFYAYVNNSWQVPTGVHILSESHSSWAEYWGENGSNASAGYVYLYPSRIEDTSYQPRSSLSGPITGSTPIKRVVTEMLDVNGAPVDAFGNVLKLRVETYDLTAGDRLAGRQTTVNRYLTDIDWIDSSIPGSAGAVPSWKLGRLSCSLVRHERDGHSGARASAFEYDPITGRLATEHAGLNVSSGAGDSWCTDQTNLSSLAARTTRYQRDAFGNIGYTYTDYAEDPAQPQRKITRGSRTDFDSAGRYVSRELVRQSASGNWGLVRTVEARDRYGNPTRVRDQFGQLHESRYETSGRLRAMASATGEISVHTIRNAHALCPAGRTAYVELAATASGGWTLSCYDLLGREVRQATRGLADSIDAAPYAFIDSYYDFQSRPVAVSEPYHDPGLANNAQQCTQGTLDLTCSTPFVTVSHFDVVGRLRRVDLPVFNGPARYQRIDYDGLRTITIDPGGYRHEMIANALGDTVEEIAPDGAITRFAYDAFGQLESVDGPLAADTITLDYDYLGHKIAMDDPDKGQWFYGHNALGELQCQLDANGNATRNDFDDLGRTVAQDLYTVSASVLANPPHTAIGALNCAALSGSSSRLDRAFIPYASTSAGRTGASGQLEWETFVSPAPTGSGWSEVRHDYGYDRYGRAHQTDTTITEPGGIDYRYTDSTRFDRYGRVLVQFDATGGSRGDLYRYSPTGHMQSMHDARWRLDHPDNPTYVTLERADARGNVVNARLGNGIELQRTYDPATGEVQLRGDFNPRAPNRYVSLY